MLSPRTSMIQKLFKAYTQPFTQVICGVPMSWDLNTAAASYPFKIGVAVWSPCNKFIAISAAHTMKVLVLDSATLQQIQTLDLSLEDNKFPLGLAFSPDTQMLTCVCGSGYRPYPPPMAANIGVVTWDLQTGGVVSIIGSKEGLFSPYMGVIYSSNGKMIAVLHSYYQMADTFISIYDVVSGVYMHNVYSGVESLIGMWTNGDSLRFLIKCSTGITIWEVGFIPGATHIEVETLSIPEKFIGGMCFLFGGLSHVQKAQSPHISYQLALYYKATHELLVWSVQNSKLLLTLKDVSGVSSVTFSSNGSFFACSTSGGEVYIWRETSTGYTLHAKFPVIAQNSQLLLSPNGESIIAFHGSAVQLSRIKGLATTSPSFPTQAPYHTGDFILDFFPDRPLLVVMRMKSNTVTVLDINSGLQQLTIETSIEGYGLRVIENTIVVLGDGKAITWNLLGINFSPDSKMSAMDSVQIIDFARGKTKLPMITAAISHDHCYIAILRKNVATQQLTLSDASDGRYLHSTSIEGGSPLWFAPERSNICSTLRGNGALAMEITQNGFQQEKIITPVALIEDKSWGCPWRISDGYQVTNDGWILSVDGKRLLMLPPLWQSSMEQQIWNGQFLVLSHGSLPEPVILKLEQ